MKITRKQLRRIIGEALEQVDWDNPSQSWDSNDQDKYDAQKDQISSQLRRVVFNAVEKNISIDDMETLFERLLEEFYYGV